MSRSKEAPSILSNDLNVTGQLSSSGDIQIDSQIKGEIRSHSLTIGEKAYVQGEIAGEDIVIRGKVTGTIIGKRVHLCQSAHVEGDIFHEALAVENGSFFNGSVSRVEDPLALASIQFEDPQPTNNVVPAPIAREERDDFSDQHHNTPHSQQSQQSGS
ncbi:MAG: bactofilin family protein [Parvibaculales bacterium]